MPYTPIPFVDQADPLNGDPDAPLLNADNLAQMQTQYAQALADAIAADTTSRTVTMTSGGTTTVTTADDVVILNAAGTIATHTVVLPSGARNGQRISVVTRQTITTLTITPSGTDTVTNPPTLLNLRGAIEFAYSAASGAWDIVNYRVGGTSNVPFVSSSGAPISIGVASAATASVLVQRDASGRTKFALPAASDDAVIRSYVDSALNLLDTGQETIPRGLAATTPSFTTGVLRLSFFTARKSETCTSIRVVTSGTPAGATPTLVRFGIFSVAANGDLTLVASTANDTTLLSVATTSYTKALSSGYAITAGQRLAVGILIVTSATAPTLISGATTFPGAELATAPRLSGAVSGQSDLPTSVLSASIGVTNINPYAVLVP